MLGLITLLGWDEEISLDLELNDDLRGLFQPNLESVTNILHLSGFNWAGSCCREGQNIQN